MKTKMFALLIALIVATACAAPTPTSAPPVPTPRSTLPIAMLKPGEKIGEMIVTTGSAKFQGPPLWAFCSPAFQKPGVTTTQCDVPPLTEIVIGHGWFATTDALRESNWKAMTWELYLDGQQLDLNAFGAYDADLPQKGLPGQDPNKEIITKLRTWDVLLTNVRPGAHTLKSVVRITQEINDGFHATKAGTYELIVNFKVADAPPKPVAVNTPIPTPTPVLITNAKDLVGIWYGQAGHALFQKFNADGTYLVALDYEGLITQPDAEGTFRFEGARLILNQVGISKTKRLPNCGAGPGIYEVYPLANGNIKFVKISETCSGRGLSTAQEHQRVNPLATPTVSITVFQPGAYTMTDNTGEWVMTFNSDGTLTLTINSSYMTPPGKGRYRVEQNTILLFDDHTCGSYGAGEYTWTFNGTELSFKTVADKCGGRSTTTTKKSWVKVR